jgi:hypothetical protein
VTDSKRFVSAGCLSVILGLAGCNPAPKLNTLPAGGTLTYNGVPVADAQVVFDALDRELGKNAVGTTDAQGRFRLRTFVGGEITADGALAGEYVMCVTKFNESIRSQFPKMPDMEDEKLKHKPDEESMRKKYGDRGPTREQRKKNDQSKPDLTKFSELPAKYMDAGKSDLRFTVKAGDVNEFAVDLQD